MNTCWKCGQPLPEGKTECADGCASRMSEEDTRKFALCLQQLAKRRRLDWSKVRSFADLMCVLSTLFGDATVDPDSAVARKLERFLEPGKEQP
jgi:predicted nucleic acid-binding Zn ribbon protein